MSNDEQIISGCINGEEKYRYMLYKQYSPILYGTALRYTNTEDDAQDVLQEAFILIFDNIKQYNGKGKLVAWMNKIVINQALKLYQKQIKNTLVDYEEYENTLIDNSVVEYDWLSYQVLLDLIHQLPAGYQMVFNLCEIEGYSYEEVAKMLNCSPVTCRSQLFKAKKKLKQKILELEKLKEIL